MMMRITANLFLYWPASSWRLMLLYHTIITINRFVSKDLIAFIPEDLKHEHGTNPVSHSHDGEDNHDNCVLGEPVVVFQMNRNLTLK